MATNIDNARLAGFFKDRFGNDASALPLDGTDILQKRIKFNSDLKLGEKITQPVQMSMPTGWTFAGGSDTGTMFALNDANSPATVEATWTGVEFTVREKTAWSTMRQAQDSAQAFGNAYDKIVKMMRESGVFALEMQLIYGSTNLGQLEAAISGSGTGRVYSITKATSAAGLWYPLAGVLIDSYTTATGGSKTNSNADIVVTSADLDDTTGKVYLTVTGNSTDLTNVDAAIAAGQFLVPKGSRTKMMTGIDAVALNTGTYAGISASTYPLWKSTSLAAGSAGLTFSKLLQAKRKNAIKSGAGPRTVIISEATGADLLDNMAALQRHVNKSGGELTLGGDSLVYAGLNGEMEILVHPFCKDGEAFMLKFDEWDRIGATPFTFDPTGKGMYFEPVSGYAGSELMGYSHEAARCLDPRTVTKITGIVNTY